MTHKPATDDYEPLIPWFGMVLIGMFIARWAVLKGHFQLVSNWRAQSKATRLLRMAGIHSLLIYMLHQPLFYSLFYIVAWFSSR